MAELNFEGLARLLLSRSRELVTDWLLGGKFVGAEYCCASIQGGKGNSLKVNVNKGCWQDFATADQKGGDLISLYAAIKGKTQGEAYMELAKDFNFEQNGAKTAVAVVEKQESDVIRPPAGTETEGQFDHREWGAPSGVWEYRSLDDELLFCVARYDPPGMKKQILPWTWNKRGFWNCKMWPGVRPLYGLELLNKFPNKKIMLVEGEKAADAAREICGHIYNVLTWSGGAQAWRKSDLTLIREREVVLWRDHDEPGIEAMAEIANVLSYQGCTVKIIETADKPVGWDAWDALNEGMDWDAFKAWAGPLVRIYENTNVATAIVENERVVAAAQAITNVYTEDVTSATRSQMEIWQELGLQVTKTPNTPLVNYENVVITILKWPPLKDLVWYDEFHDKIFTFGKEERRREWTDNDDYELAIYFQHEMGI